MGNGRGDCREEATELAPEASSRQRKTPGTWGGRGPLSSFSPRVPHSLIASRAGLRRDVTEAFASCSPHPRGSESDRDHYTLLSILYSATPSKCPWAIGPTYFLAIPLLHPLQHPAFSRAALGHVEEAPVSIAWKP